MSVFTPLTHALLADFIRPYQLGRLIAFSGTPDGTENSTFFVHLEQGDCVLTLVEQASLSDVSFCVALLARLHQAHLPVPYVLIPEGGSAVGQLAGKPALLQPRLAGKHPLQPHPSQCAAIGDWLARLHCITASAPLMRPMGRDLSWIMQEGTRLLALLPVQQRPALQKVLQELPHLHSVWSHLPVANLHTDLFRDNALFDGARLSGVIDFYSACSGPMLYDVAVTLNDWCSEPNGRLDAARVKALLGAYASHRPFTLIERRIWPALLRVACVRFWISRWLAVEAHQGQEAVLIKDPEEFYQRLQARTDQDCAPAALPLDL